MGKFEPVCAELFWSKIFIVPVPIPKPTPILDPRFLRDLEHNIYRASVSTTSRPQLKSGR